MRRIKELICTRAEPLQEDIVPLEEFSERYPWFALSRMLLMQAYLNTGENEKYKALKHRLAARFLIFPAPGLSLKKIDTSSLKKLGRMTIIEDFLSRESRRIVIDENFSQNGMDISLASVEEKNDDVVSERLAQIYLSQGLEDKAINIYRKLSLKFPEKSVYFADIIKRAESDK